MAGKASAVVSGFVLETIGLSKAYRGVKALDGVDLRVSRGEIRGLIGPNGAGKSTLVDVTSGRLRPSSGRVMLDGADITSSSIGRRRRAGLSRTFQRTSIFPALTVRAHLAVAALRFPDSDFGPIVAGFGLAALANKRADEIAYGEQRRLDIALAMVGDPQVLLLDEPAAGLAKHDSRQLADHLQQLAKTLKVTVVLIEHDMDVVFGVSDSVTVLAAGCILAEGRPDEVRRNDSVIRAYLGSSR